MDSSGGWMNEKIASPNTSCSDPRRCPASWSSFQACLSTAETLCAWLLPWSLRIAPAAVMLSTFCPEDEACIMPGLGSWAENPSMLPAMFPATGAAEPMGLIDTSDAIFFRGGWDAERSVLDFRLFGLLVATLLLLLRSGRVDGQSKLGNNLSRSYKHLPAAHSRAPYTRHASFLFISFDCFSSCNSGSKSCMYVWRLGKSRSLIALGPNADIP